MELGFLRSGTLEYWVIYVVLGGSPPFTGHNDVRGDTATEVSLESPYLSFSPIGLPRDGVLIIGVATLASRQSDNHTPSLPTREMSIRTRDTPRCLGEKYCIRPRLSILCRKYDLQYFAPFLINIVTII